jgi:transposase-like protein
MRPYRRWSMELKRSAVSRMASEAHGALAAELGIDKRVLYLWRTQLRVAQRKSKQQGSRVGELERENLRLKQALGTKALEADFFKGVLRSIEAQRRPASGSGETASSSASE